MYNFNSFSLANFKASIISFSFAGEQKYLALPPILKDVNCDSE
jgi:hypothetical protein